jgi:yecA family protein
MPSVETWMLEETRMPKWKLGRNLTCPELKTLDEVLTSRVLAHKAMTLDTLDGFLHAVILCERPLHIQNWLPSVWNMAKPSASLLPVHYQSPLKSQQVLALIARFNNGIVRSVKSEPVRVDQIYQVIETDHQPVEDARGWARGFVAGMRLAEPEWAICMDHPQFKAWFEPIRCLSEQDPDIDLAQCSPSYAQNIHRLSGELTENLLNMVDFCKKQRHQGALA